ncbi:MAG: rhodanese-like domain-containing protein [archaeon]
MYFEENKNMLFVYLVVAVVIGVVIGFAITNFVPKSSTDLIKEFYATEVVSSMSPSDYVGDLSRGISDGLVVDLRSAAEYNAGHLVSAVSIPSVELDEATLLAEFKKLPKDKPIITYCYASYCMLSRHVGKYLSDNGIYAMHFTAGWYEITRDLNSYVVSGPSPGTLSGDLISVDNSTQNNPLVCSASGAAFTC